MKSGHAIPDDALGGARNVRDAARAAARSPEARASIDRIVAKVGFRRYRQINASWAFEAAAQAVNAFFTDGSTLSPERVVEQSIDHASAHADLMDDIRRSRAFSSLRDAAAAAVSARFPKIPRIDIVARVSSFLAEEIGEAIDAADLSVPMDAIGGTDIIVCYLPGLREGASLEDTMTSHWTSESSSLTVKPDEAFMHFLTLANVSVPQWLDEVEKATGERVDQAPSKAPRWKAERAAAWSGAAAETDSTRPAAVKPWRLVEAVDACYLGFSPLIAFNADAGSLCSRDWNNGLGIKGGVLGLHDFVNGSGDPLRFEHKVVVQAKPGNMIVGEARPFDFNEVHGFVRHSFRSRLTEECPAPDPCPPSP